MKLEKIRIMKRVINGETGHVIEKFDQKETDQFIEKYEEDGWSDVDIDIDGDIILWDDE